MTALKSGDAECESKVKSLLRQEKREKGILLEAKINPKAFWAHAKRKLKTKVGVAPLLSDPTNKESLKFEDSEKANILKEQLSSVFTKEPGGNIPRMSIEHPRFGYHEGNGKETDRCLNPNKSIGPDGMHAKLIIELTDYLVEPLALIFNETLRYGIIPRNWKRTNVCEWKNTNSPR